MDAVEEVHQIRAQIKALSARESELKKEIIEEYGTGRGTVGNLLLTIRPNARFNADVAREVLTEEELAKVSVLEPKAALVKVHLPLKVEACQKVSGYVVDITLNPDAQSVEI